MNFLKYSAFYIMLISLNSHAISFDENQTPDALGGGTGYSRMVSSSQATYLVGNLSELKDALSKVKSGQIIYIKDDAEIDLTTYPNISITISNLTIASGRGQSGSRGALLFSKRIVKGSSFSQFNVKAEGFRMTGLRLRGPTSVRDFSGCEKYESIGIKADGINNIEVDNNEVFNWPYAGVSVATVNFDSPKVFIHSNFIHNNLRRESDTSCVTSSSTTVKYGHALGYGVVVGNGFAFIYDNIFSKNRHDIAGNGLDKSSYIATYNLSMPGEISHSFDMHGCQDSPNSSVCYNNLELAGKFVNIKYNTFFGNEQPGIVYRGEPRELSTIDNNVFAHSSEKEAFNNLIKYPSGQRVLINMGPGQEYNYKAKTYSDPVLTALFGEMIGDFDGDGIPEILFRALCGADAKPCWRSHKWNRLGKLSAPKLSSGSNLGDGLYMSELTQKYNIAVGDFNNDGKDDIAYFGKCGTPAVDCLRVQISDGKNLAAKAFRILESTELNFDETFGIQVGDFNGDGKDDLLMKYSLCQASKCFALYKSNGNSFTLSNYKGDFTRTFDSNSQGWRNGIRVGDFNLDGKDDFVYFGNCEGYNQYKFQLSSSSTNEFATKCSKFEEY